jgi:hypothetical protein
MTLPRASFVLVAALWCGAPSCGPAKSLHPLGDPATATPDHRLVGTWTTKSDGDDLWLHVAKKPGAALDFVLVGAEKQKGLVLLAFDGFPTTIGAQRFLSLRARTSGEYGEGVQLADRFIFVRYDVTKDGVLALDLLDEDAVAEAITAKALAGRVPAEGPVTIDAPTDVLAAWIARQPARAWTWNARWRRVPSPPAR